MSRKRDMKLPRLRKRVFLLDHFAISRLAISAWLKETSDLTVCGEADNAASALADISKLKPDIVLAEIIRQQDLGFIRSLRSRHPDLPILVFSFRDEEWYAPLVLKAGAQGFLAKAASSRELLDKIRSVLASRVLSDGKGGRSSLVRLKPH